MTDQTQNQIFSDAVIDIAEKMNMTADNLLLCFSQLMLSALPTLKETEAVITIENIGQCVVTLNEKAPSDPVNADLNTMLTLKYADASNYKQSQGIVLRGLLNEDQLIDIGNQLQDWQSLIAEQVGLPTVSEKSSESHNFPTEDDHVWTTIEEFQSGTPSIESIQTTDEPTEEMSALELYNAIMDVTEWDIDAETKRLGIPD